MWAYILHQLQTELFKTSPNCPKCKEPFTKETSEAYPINFALFRSVDAHNVSTTTEGGLLKPMFDAKRKLATIEKEWKDTKTEVDSNLSKISNAEKSIEDLLNQKCLDVERSNETLLEINKIIKEVSNIKFGDDRRLKNSVTLNRDDYHNNQDFLQEIYTQLDNNEEIYAVTTIDSKVNYAHLTRYSNRIYLHAFDPSVPVEPNKTIWLSDFKSCCDDSLRAFFDIPFNNKGTHVTVVLKTVNNSNLVPLFLKYCTGEAGPVYKGTQFDNVTMTHRNYSSWVTKPIVLSQWGQEYNFRSDYEQKDHPENMEDFKGNVCTLNDKGCFKFVHYEYTNTPGLVAIIEEPKTNYFNTNMNYQDLIIRDSGIFIEV